MGKIKNNYGFSLIELVCVIAIIAIILAVAIPSFTGLTDSTKTSMDKYTLRELNNKTELYRIDNFESDAFDNSSNSDEALMGLLVENDYLDKEPVPKDKDSKFSWDYNKKIWTLSDKINLYEITTNDGMIISNGRLSGSYSGKEKNILIPYSLNGIIIRDIYQDAFRNKGLTDLNFSSNSNVRQIHARAFYNNKLTTVNFPNSLERIDLWSFRDNQLTKINLPTNLISVEQFAFSGNNLTEISIGSKVGIIQNQAFGTYTESFKVAYSVGGSGTYTLLNGVWVKK